MRKSVAIGILTGVSEKLRNEKIPYSSVYLFGSFAKNKATKWSDIDMALVSDKFKNDNMRNWITISKLAKEVDIRIELHGFSVKDFEDLNNPMVYEIRTTGIRIK